MRILCPHYCLQSKGLRKNMNPFFNGKQSYGAQILTDISYYNSQHHHPEIQPLFAMIFSLCKNI